MTQIDFFAQLPIKLQAKLEAFVHPDQWPLN